VEALGEGEAGHIKEEIGDIMLVLALLTEIYEERGDFTMSEVFDGIREKIIRRHPHVFGDVKVKDSEEVLRNWARIKIEQEGRKPKDSCLDGVSGALPPLDRAAALQRKAAKQGFDWTYAEDVCAKIEEELAEVKTAAENAIFSGEQNTEAQPDSHLEEELGDLLFSVVNLCRFYKIDPSFALQKTCAKFTNRFKHVEKRMKESGQEMCADNLAVMDAFWNEAKGCASKGCADKK